MAPNSNKPYRVCDNCFAKLTKASETNSSTTYALSRRGSMNQGPNEVVDKTEKLDSRTHAQFSQNDSIEPSKELEGGSCKRNKRLDFNNTQVSPFPNGVSPCAPQSNSKLSNAIFGSSKKIFSASLPGSRIVSRATSPTSRRSSPPRATTPTPTLSGFASMKVVDDAKRTNEGLSEEVVKLRTQVEELTCKAQLQEVELERTTDQLKEAIAMATEETAKCKAAKEVIKSLTTQLKDMAERLPIGAARSSNSPSFCYSSSIPPRVVSSAGSEQLGGPLSCHEIDSNESNCLVISNGPGTINNHLLVHSEMYHLDATSKNRSRTTKVEPTNGDEWVEQDEPGVYITLVALPGGIKDLKRVRFSRKRFSEKQAEQWWAANRARVYHRYNVPLVDKPSIGLGREGLAH